MESYGEWSAKEWLAFAARCASDAHEKRFSDRRGVWHLENADVLCFFNNTPFDSSPKRREQGVAGFRDRIQAAGINELAYAIWPPAGNHGAGYTFAMIVKASRDQQDRLVSWWKEPMLKGIADTLSAQWLWPLVA